MLFTSRKNDSDKTVHDLQLQLAWVKSRKTTAEHYILPFFAYLHDKRNIFSFGSFIHPSYTEPASLTHE